MSGVRLEIHRDGWTGGLQLSIGNDYSGYRLIGPKFNGSSEVIASRVLDDRDIAELRRYCDEAERAAANPGEGRSDG